MFFQSEYIAESDKRRKWISGFDGSAGFAVVTLDSAALWTDGRYRMCHRFRLAMIIFESSLTTFKASVII